MPYNKLSPKERHVIENKGTEAPFTGEYDSFYEPGTYICRRCNNPLYDSKAKFDAKCGWPAFDDHFVGAVKRTPHWYPKTWEIDCANCGAHLGHVFKGEKFTDKDTRHCVNSISVKFVREGEKLPKVLSE